MTLDRLRAKSRVSVSSKTKIPAKIFQIEPISIRLVGTGESYREIPDILVLYPMFDDRAPYMLFLLAVVVVQAPLGPGAVERALRHVTLQHRGSAAIEFSL